MASDQLLSLHMADIVVLQKVDVAASKNQIDQFHHRWEWIFHAR